MELMILLNMRHRPNKVGRQISYKIIQKNRGLGPYLTYIIFECLTSEVFLLVLHPHLRL